jgi:hypothetical protein
MRQTNLKDIAEILGVIAIVLSLAFVGIQLQQDQKIAEAQAYIDSASQITELNQLIAENRGVWVRGLDGEELSREDELIFQSIYRALFVRKIAQWQRATKLNAGNPDSFAQGFAYAIHIYPGLRRAYEQMITTLEEKRSAFGRTRSDDNFAADVDTALAQLKENPPPAPTVRNYYIY